MTELYREVFCNRM